MLVLLTRNLQGQEFYNPFHCELSRSGRGKQQIPKGVHRIVVHAVLTDVCEGFPLQKRNDDVHTVCPAFTVLFLVRNVIPDDFFAPLFLAATQEAPNFRTGFVAVTVIEIRFLGPHIHIGTDPMGSGFVMRIQIEDDSNGFLAFLGHGLEIQRTELIYDAPPPDSRHACIKINRHRADKFKRGKGIFVLFHDAGNRITVVPIRRILDPIVRLWRTEEDGTRGLFYGVPEFLECTVFGGTLVLIPHTGAELGPEFGFRPIMMRDGVLRKLFVPCIPKTDQHFHRQTGILRDFEGGRIALKEIEIRC